MEERRDEDERTPDGRSAFLAQSLRGILDEAEIAAALGAPPEVLGDVLLDHLPAIPVGNRLAVIGEALLVWTFGRVREALEREHLLIDPRAAADYVLLDILWRTLAGHRRRPLGSWIHERIARAFEIMRYDDACLLYPFESGQSDEARRQAILARGINRLDSAVRRLVWLAWVEWRTPEELELLTGWTWERIELILDRMLSDFTNDWLGSRPDDRPQEPGSREFWRIMGEERGHDEA